MQTVIITRPLELIICGLGSTAVLKDYTATAFRLSGAMWQIIKQERIKNKGKNIWVYGTGDQVFAGVEPDDPAADFTTAGLSSLTVRLEKYAYYKHTGSYSFIQEAGQLMRRELAATGQAITLPYIEIYGHWTNDEDKLETELIMALP